MSMNVNQRAKQHQKTASTTLVVTGVNARVALQTYLEIVKVCNDWFFL